MNRVRQLAKFASHTMPGYVVVAILYTILALTLPANQLTLQTYNLDLDQYRLLQLTTILPTLIIWLVAFIGYAKLREYARSISETKEGPHFVQLARGAMFLAWTLPLGSINTMLINAISTKWPGTDGFVTILGNYSYIIVLLIALTLIGSASRGLISHGQLKYSLTSVKVLTVIFLVLGVTYCYLTFRSFDLSSLNSNQNPYSLPIWLVVLTIIVPNLYGWFIGMLASYEISLFSKNVRGLLYRKALSYLAIGLICVIVSSIAVQYIASLQRSKGYPEINYELAIMVLFRVLRFGGFVLIAIGAVRLKKIEEV